MSEKYRGFDVPEVVKEGNGYHIIDPAFDMVIDGYTEERAIQRWKDFRDNEFLRQLLADNRVQHIEDDTYGCLGCGSLLFDVYRHAETCSA